MEEETEQIEIKHFYYKKWTVYLPEDVDRFLGRQKGYARSILTRNSMTSGCICLNRSEVKKVCSERYGRDPINLDEITWGQKNKNYLITGTGFTYLKKFKVNKEKPDETEWWTFNDKDLLDHYKNLVKYKSESSDIEEEILERMTIGKGDCPGCGKEISGDVAYCNECWAEKRL